MYVLPARHKFQRFCDAVGRRAPQLPFPLLRRIMSSSVGVAECDSEARISGPTESEPGRKMQVIVL